MNCKQRERVLHIINAKQEEIKRREVRLSKLAQEEPFNEKKYDKIDELLQEDYTVLRGMILMVDGLLATEHRYTNRVPKIVKKSDPVNPFVGTWHFEDLPLTPDQQYYQNRKCYARMEAIDYQHNFEQLVNDPENPMSVSDYTEHFRKLGKRFGLLEEFKENAII